MSTLKVHANLCCCLQPCLPILLEFEALVRVVPGLRLGGGVSKSGETALMIAAAAGHQDVCEWLLAAVGEWPSPACLLAYLPHLV